MANKNKKNVLITGSSSGIGLCCEDFLIKSGYRVFGCGRRKLNKDNYLSVDLSSKEGCENLVLKAREYLGRIDILVNVAGIYLYSGLEETKYQDIEEMTKINFIAPYYISSLVLGDMKKNHWGRIVSIGSISGAVGEGNASLYSGTKSALSGFTKALALEVAQDNITVNLINPGWVETPLADDAIEQSDFTLQDNLDMIPQRRFIEPIEVAKLVHYLISEDAKGLTGQTINLCAGLSLG